MRVQPRSDDFEINTGFTFPERTTVDQCTITIVPRYSETDQSGVVHHTVYPVWFEMGRTELLRANGLAYSVWKSCGVNSPILTGSSPNIPIKVFRPPLTRVGRLTWNWPGPAKLILINLPPIYKKRLTWLS